MLDDMLLLLVVELEDMRIAWTKPNWTSIGRGTRYSGTMEEGCANGICLTAVVQIFLRTMMMMRGACILMRRTRKTGSKEGTVILRPKEGRATAKAVHTISMTLQRHDGTVQWQRMFLRRQQRLEKHFYCETPNHSATMRRKNHNSNTALGGSTTEPLPTRYLQKIINFKRKQRLPPTTMGTQQKTVTITIQLEYQSNDDDNNNNRPVAAATTSIGTTPPHRTGNHP